MYLRKIQIDKNSVISIFIFMDKIPMLANAETMTSLEIAEITGRLHKDVMRAIRNMEPAWKKINGRKFALVEYEDAKGEKRPCYQLTKTECLYIATKFNDEARAKLVIRWEELEMDKRKSYPMPQTFGEALMLAAKQQLQIEEQQQTIEAHETEILALSDKISEMKPKAVYYDQILKSKNTVLVTQIAKDYGYSAYKFNQLLETLHIQYKVREQWVLYAEHSDKGYTKSTSYPVDCHDGTYITKMRTEWTQKGRLFLYETFKANNILPLIEQ